MSYTVAPLTVVKVAHTNKGLLDICYVSRYSTTVKDTQNVPLLPVVFRYAHLYTANRELLGLINRLRICI